MNLAEKRADNLRRRQQKNRADRDWDEFMKMANELSNF